MIQVRRDGPTTAALCFQYNKLRQSVAKAGSFFHVDMSSNATTGDPLYPDGSSLAATAITTNLPANATDLPTSIALANALQTYAAVHAADSQAIAGQGGAGAHLVADTTNAPTLAAIPVASNLATTQTLANGLKVFFNAHYTQAGVHVNNDGTNTIAAANATDLPSSQTLLNAIKTAMVAHVASAPAGSSIFLAPI